MSNSKHFGNAYGTLKVKDNGDNGSIYVTVDSQGSHAGVGIEDAPALCLAILEAAGLVRDVCSGDDAEVALDFLYSAVARREREAKETADREKLQSEAWELFTAWNPDTKHGSVSVLPSFLVEEWTRIARKAREIHGGTK